jgi:hypothetical protein
MGRRIIKKKNGLWAVWTTVCDNFIMDDVTQEEMIEKLSEEAKRDTRKRIEDQIKNNQCIHTDYEERCERRDELHSEAPDKKGFFE